ncbi:MAG: hypothetical protein DI630_00905 [Gordonia sp. (in: high G+C Gram-positive bacteria)]|nr:MAG: hypothetical protein DI630_00905 [Gordonia sp. (in: high G+C Gram-positive bacteria)]
MCDDTPQISAAIVRKYADLKEGYLHGNTDFHGANTSDSDRWLMCEIAGYRKAADLICAPTAENAEMGLPSAHWPAWNGMVEEIRTSADAARARKERIIAGVHEAVNATFDDGTPVLKYIFLADPELAARLRTALGFTS